MTFAYMTSLPATMSAHNKPSVLPHWHTSSLSYPDFTYLPTSGAHLI